MPAHGFPRCWGISTWFGRTILRLLGWTVHQDFPEGLSKAIVIAAPHTSNWDWFYALWAGWAMGISFSWLGKKELFRPPFGWLFRAMGGQPVERSAAQGLVQAAAERIRKSEALLLMVPAEGTRSYRKYWKSGFYFMAQEAGVPILLGFLDFGKKQAGIGPALMPSGNIKADMDVIRAFYADKTGVHPALKSDIRLEQEDVPEAKA